MSETSVAVPALRLSDLPERPRPIAPHFQIATLFSASLAQAGLCGVAFAVVMGGFFAKDTDARDHDDDAVRGSAVVSDAFDWTSDKDGSIWRVVATGVVDGAEQTVVSYFSDKPPTGAVVLAGDDDHLVIQGGRLRPHTAASLLYPLLLLLSTLAVVVGSLRTGLRRLALLRDGAPTTARFVEKAEVKIDDHSHWRLTYRFVDDTGATRTHVETAGRHHGHLVDDDDEPLLYDDHHAALLDALPGRPRLQDGRFVARHPRRAAALAVAAVVVAGAGVAAVPALWWLALR